MQEWFNIWKKKKNVMHYINKIKGEKKKHMIISTSAEKAFDKVQCPFMIKSLELGIEGNYFNITKAIYENIIFNIKRLKTFPLRSGTMQR